MGELRINVLGMFELRDDDRLVRVGAAKHRQMLALLASSPDRTVRTETFATELWSHGQPQNAVTTIQTYIYELRKILRATTAGPLVTDAAGYRLRIAATQVDAARFAELIDRGDGMLADDRARRWHGQPEPDRARVAVAAQILREGLGLWRGSPYSGMATGPILTAHGHLLEQTWLRAVERRVRADLLLGRHRELVGELKALAADHPLNETFHSQLMVALCRCGRRSEALQVYGRFRGALREQLQLEPPRRMKWLRYRIIGTDAEETTLAG